MDESSDLPPTDGVASQDPALLADDDGNPIGTRESCVSDGLPSSTDDRLVRAFASLTPAEIAQIVANRAVVERAKGMLMFVYDIDADSAFELLKWRSQTTNVKLRQLAKQLTEDLVRANRDSASTMRLACDSLLFTVDERVSSAADSTPANAAGTEHIT